MLQGHYTRGILFLNREYCSGTDDIAGLADRDIDLAAIGKQLIGLYAPFQNYAHSIRRFKGLEDGLIFLITLDKSDPL